AGSEADIIATPLQLIYCPTRGREKVIDRIAVSDYNRNGGTYGTLSELGPWANSFDGVLTPSGEQAINFGNITDGTSNTLLIGEKWLYVRWYDDRTTGNGS